MRLWSGNDRQACRHVTSELQAYLDGELQDAAKIARVAEHLEACRRCGLDAETYRTLKDDLARLARPVDRGAVERLRDFVESLQQTPAEQCDEGSSG